MGCVSAPGCQGERAGLSVQLCARQETTELLLGSYHLPMCLYRLSRASAASLWRREGGVGERREVGMLRSIGRRSLSADIQRSAISWWSQIRRRKAARFTLLFLCFSLLFSLSVFFFSVFFFKTFSSLASGVLESSLKPFHFLNPRLGCVHAISGAATNAGRVSRQLNRGGKRKLM